jgi:hypothetical protein
VTLDELPGYLRMLAVRAGEAAIPASNGMSGAFDKEVKRRLTALSHARGTRTPAPPGGPPAMESGQLAGSVQQVPASTPVVATSSVAPHKSPRDWVQEFGMDGIRPVRAPYMRFTYGDRYRAKVVNVPDRSYMRTTTDLMVADGSLTRAAAGAFYAAMWG